LRVPGTVNWKNKKNGRVPALALPYESRDGIVNDIGHVREVLERAEPREEKSKSKRNKKGSSRDTDFELDPDQLEDVAFDDPRLSRLKPWVMELGREGKAKGRKYKSDSHAVAAFTIECVRAKVSDHVIASILMDSRWKISVHVIAQGNNDKQVRAAERHITWAHDKADLGGVSLDEFRAYMPMHSYIYTPTRDPWPAASVNACAARGFTAPTFTVTDLHEAVAIIRAAADKVTAGNLSEMEAMLTAQAITLNTVFIEMARRASLNMGDYLPATETYLRLALKAQSQCRTTVEALAEIKNPRPMAFVRQANIAQGPQQVNNQIGSGADPRAHAGISANRSNGVLGVSDGKRLESRAARAASGAHPKLGAVEVLHGAEDRRGEGNQRAERQ
jgi:hypothetical protein